MTFTFPPDLGWYYAEEQAVRDAWWHPAAGQVVIDIGAMMGNYTLPALAAGARVIAVDPNTRDTDRLQAVAGMNGYASRLTVISAALFDGGDYPAAMRAALAASPYAHLMPPPGTPFMTLDELAAECGLDRLDWIKMDVEGAEAGVLRGSLGSLARWHPRLLIEDHSRPYPWVAEQQITRQCTDLLASAGYHAVRQVPFDELRTFIVAREEAAP